VQAGPEDEVPVCWDHRVTLTHRLTHKKGTYRKEIVVLIVRFSGRKVIQSKHQQLSVC
jgi:DNA-directed RNA polymerase beta' subunit